MHHGHRGGFFHSQQSLAFIYHAEWNMLMK